MEGVFEIGELKEYFDTLDRIRTVFDKIESNVQIPQIAVIGNQSVGKSSVLELISGVRLPQGNDIVTRCPILLQIRRTAISKIELNGETLEKHELGVKLTAAQDKLIKQYCTRARNQVTAKPVILNMCGPDLRDLTLVDLPGINYSEDALKNSIIKMIESYICSSATIILLINNCTSDPTSTEALALARKHDPKQERTIFILTKPDEIKNDDVEKKEALMKLIRGEHTQLYFACGTFIVKGRQSNHTELTIQQVRDLEVEFFESQAVFDTCWDMGKAGSFQVVKTIEKLALRKMKQALPAIRMEVLTSLKRTRDDLHNFPLETLPLGEDKKLRIVTNTINDVYLAYKHAIEYELGQTLKVLFEMMEIKVLNLLRNESNKEKVIQEIVNSGGLHPNGFASTEKFRSLYQINLQQVVNVAENTIYEVQYEVKGLVDAIISKKGREIGLEHEFLGVLNDVFRSNLHSLFKLFKDLIEAEMMPYLPDFMEFFFEGEKQLEKIPLAFTLHGELPGFDDTPESLCTVAAEEENSERTLSFIENEDDSEICGIDKMDPIDEGRTLKKDEKRKKSFRKIKKEKIVKSIFHRSNSEDSVTVDDKHRKEFSKALVPVNRKLENVKKLNVNDLTSDVQGNAQMREAKSKKFLEGKLVYEAYRTYLYHTSVTLLMTVPKIICHHFFVKFPEDLQKTLLSMILEFSENMPENTDAKIKYDRLVENIANLEESLTKIKNLISKTH